MGYDYFSVLVIASAVEQRSTNWSRSTVKTSEKNLSTGT